MNPSGWTNVDDQSHPSRLFLGLDRVAEEPFFQNRRARILKLLATRPGEVIIDLGCGTASLIAALGPSEGSTILGVDLSAAMLREARRRHPEVRLVRADVRRLPIMENSVDAFVATAVLQHLPHPPVALAEWRRILVPGGRFVTSDADLHSMRIEGVDQTVAEVVCDFVRSTRPGIDSVADLTSELKRAQFTNINVESETLELNDLRQADGIFGLVEWGDLAAQAEVVDRATAREWRTSVEAAWRAGRLHYECQHAIATGTKPLDD